MVLSQRLGDMVALCTDLFIVLLEIVWAAGRPTPRFWQSFDSWWLSSLTVTPQLRIWLLLSAVFLAGGRCMGEVDRIHPVALCGRNDVSGLSLACCTTMLKESQIVCYTWLLAGLGSNA